MRNENIGNEETKICLTIAGVDPSGGAGIIADIKTFSAFGCFGASVITSITFQNTQGVFGVEHQTAESVRKQLEPILDDFNISAVKTGMLPNREIIEETARIIKESAIENVVVDPVVRSTSGFDLIDDEALRSLIKTFFPISKVVTPNIPEAERISQIQIKTMNDLHRTAEIIRGMGAKNILIKGGHFTKSKEKKAQDYLFVENKLEIFEKEFIKTSSTHGTGCVLASSITANLALEQDLIKSIEISKDFVHEAIKNAPHIGKGYSPIGINSKI